MSSRRMILFAMCLAGLLGLGIQVVYAVLICWGYAVGEQLIPSRRPSEDLRILDDGTPVIVTYMPTEYQSRSARTLDDEPVEFGKLDHGAPACQLAGLEARGRARRGWSGRILAYSDCREPAGYWYFVHTGEKDGRGYFVGYDSKLKLRVGYIGIGGFRPDKPPPGEWFHVDGRRLHSGGHATSQQRYYYYVENAAEPSYYRSDSPLEPIRGWLVYLVSKDGLLEIDLQARTVRTVIESGQLVSTNLVDRLYSVSPAVDPRVQLERRTYLAVRLQDRVLVLDPFGRQRRSYLLPEQVRAKPINFYEKRDGTAIVEVRPRKSRSPADLYWVRDSGGVLRSDRVVLREYPCSVVLFTVRNVYLGRPRGIEDRRIISALFGLVSPVPAVWVGVATVAVPIEHLEADRARTYPEALVKSLSETWPGVAISVVLSGVAVWLCVRRQRQYALRWTRTWGVFVFLLGIPGLLGYLFHRRWPVREECPACSQAVPRDRESCAACGMEFPEPAPKGIEVFA